MEIRSRPSCPGTCSYRLANPECLPRETAEGFQRHQLACEHYRQTLIGQGAVFDLRPATLQVGALTLHTKRREATRAGRLCKPLSPREADLLELLMRNPGQVCSREQILKEAWGFEFDPGTNIVEKNIERLRKKINDGFETDLIEVKCGYGYRLSADH